MLADQFGESIIDVVPHGVCSDCAELVPGNFDRKVHLPAVSNVDDRRSGTTSYKKVGYRFDGPLRRGEPDAHRRLRRQFVQRSEEHTSELQSQSNLVCRLLLEKKKYQKL